MKVILVRHAQTEWNQRGIIQGHMDSPVTKRGALETSALLEALTDAAYPTDYVYASPLGRAWHMGQALADCFLCPLVAEPALKEQAFGHYEGMTREQIQSDYPSEAESLFARDAQFCPPGGESLTQASQRVINFLHSQQTVAPHQTICIVSHGQVSQGVLALLKEGRIDNFSSYAQPNASYSVLDLAGNKCVTLRWGIATHLLKLL
ncbi:histidine phosphatase family protein [Serratia fonticola]|uniref:histidine phosphatase family protein n=1 Tax=Serratia fonticola TaxID=47917 RepID=UPI0027F06B6F|nr:histidine phosphatase family protein [Serratia fonticola]MDQ7207772.1 histidine phosphatase family protein [Serratia fonticola]HBE9078011.1 histidine phosphatase family protein [Serratia fonticola]HBE9083137.1 histidine phosphatase family protein [Serratia fonticola]HBE9088538.1 histidine phosphatase family protein [Serratia fonticola]HBE9150736.1 histidine phosphatase family protein [Serratia fonticola]